MRNISIIVVFYLSCVRRSLLGFMPRLKNPYVYMATTDVIVLPEDYEEDITRVTTTTASVPGRYKDTDELYLEVDTEPTNWIETSFANTENEMEFEKPLFIKKSTKDRLKNHSKISALNPITTTSSETQSSDDILTPEQYIINDDWPATPPHYVQTRSTTEFLTSRLLVSETQRDTRTWRSYFPTKAPKTLVPKSEPVYEDLKVTWKNYVPWRIDIDDYSTIEESYRRTYSSVVRYKKPVYSDVIEFNPNLHASKTQNIYSTIVADYRKTYSPDMQDYKQPDSSDLIDFYYVNANKPAHVYPTVVADYRRTYPPEVQHYTSLESHEPYRINLYSPESPQNTESNTMTDTTTFPPDPVLSHEYLLRKKPPPSFYSPANKTNRCYQCGHSEQCYKVFDQESMVDRHNMYRYKKHCEGSTFIGGCYKRYVDVDYYLSERGCRHIPPERWSSFASHRFKKLEYLLSGITEGCTSSPVAGLMPFSRPISLHVRFHVCVCVTRLCNSASKLTGIFSSFLFYVLYFVCFLYFTNKYL